MYYVCMKYIVLSKILGHIFSNFVKSLRNVLYYFEIIKNIYLLLKYFKSLNFVYHSQFITAIPKNRFILNGTLCRQILSYFIYFSIKNKINEKYHSNNNVSKYYRKIVRIRKIKIMIGIFMYFYICSVLCNVKFTMYDSYSVKIIKYLILIHLALFTALNVRSSPNVFHLTNVFCKDSIIFILH